MSNQEIADGIREILTKYVHHRKLWIKKYKTDEGFDDWFTRQIFRAKKLVH